MSGQIVAHSTTRFSLLAVLLAAACSSGEDEGRSKPGQPPKPEQGQTEFVSDLSPNDEASSDEPTDADASDDTAEGAPAPSNEAPEAERAITEADIVHIEGDTLYALSEFSGLTLVDLADPTELEAIGHMPSKGTPFEMYVQDNIVISMVDAFGRYEIDEQTQQTTWVQSSRIVTLDTSNPSAIKVLGELSVPGSISDSRLVGDVLYLVTNEAYGCWGCSKGPSTVITTFDLSELQDINVVDQLRFEEPEETYIGSRSILVTPERIYIGGRNWNWEDTTEGSTIQVVDISDPEGVISAGAALPITGQIDSRWQMDEHEGVLRVLSQWEDWRDDSPPALETYRVNSATDITKLATLQVQLPRPEVLQSVRFDAERAYAITFEQTDPLFTFDLSDPEAPKQVGELEIPGWVYHMEPRGNRIYAIGFDDENETGALHVSLFDVEDMANPTMLQRVNFGGDWGSFSEDQDRIHKSFKLLDQHGMMVVPFSGHDWDDNSCNSTYLSGIQLVDYTSDALTLRGVAPQVGRARRAFVHEDRLFGVSDDAVQSFDIENRDDIKKLDTLETARNVSTVRLVGDKVLRFGTDWWTERTVLDVANVSELTRPESQQSLDLSQLLADSSGECSSYAYWGNVYTYGQFAYVERHSYSYADDQSEQRLTLLVVDVGQAKPVVIDQVQLHLSSEPDVYSYFSGAIQTTSALLLGITRHDYSADESKIETTYKVLDVREPSHPVVVSDLKVPQSLADQGWGRLSMGCDVDMGWGWRGYYADEPSALVSGDIISSSHAEALPNDTFRARYYLDRFDLSDPENPKHLEKVNIPGRAAHFDAESGQLLSIEERVEVLDVSQDECWDRSNSEPDVRFHYTDDYDTGRCERVQQLMHNLTVEDQSATLQGSVALHGGDWYLNSTAVTGDRIFVRQYQTQRVVEETYEYWTSANSRVRVFDTALNKLADFEDVANAWGSLHARGTRAFSSEQGVLRVFDATDPDAPKSYERELLGYGCEALEVRGDTAVCAQGKKGVELIELD